MQRPKRAMWLMNHSTLRRFDVPLLEALGYEVYLPKIFPYDEGNLSGSGDDSRDAALTIPREDLEVLNGHDFYSGLTPAIGEMASRHFDLAFLGFFPDQLAGLVRHFRNTIIMRPFGLSAGDSYTAITAATLGPAFLHELELRRKDFWFGQAYDHLAEIETGIFRDKAITLPLGIDDAVVRDAWTGTDPRILFVCPRIGSSPYFNRIYRNFLKTFGDMPHVIGGAQPIAVEDPNVTGFLSREAYDDMMRKTRVMFYHSQEERHLHYHPIEAVRIGMPLVFMAGGLLDRLGGRNLPGRCSTEAEAKDKIRRILAGDSELVRLIRSSQGVLLRDMSREVCEPVWRRNFRRLEAAQPVAASAAEEPAAAPKKVAVFLPEPFKGGTLNMVKLAAKMLKKGSAEQGRECTVVFAHPEDPIYDDSDFADLKRHRIEVRPFKWKRISSFQLADIYACIGYDLTMPGGSYSVPKDGATDFMDCDFWLIGSDRFYDPIAPLRPYCLFAQDYLQRYFPDSVSPDYEMSYLTAARNALAVLASTPHTLRDVVNYAGIPRKKAVLVPLVAEFEPFATTDAAVEKQDYFVWTTNAAPHKNHKMTFEALSRYFNSSDAALDCHVTGVGTDRFDPRKRFDDLPTYVRECREYLDRNPAVLERLTFFGNLSQEAYVRQLQGARFLLHNVVMDNGTLSSIEAACMSTPTLSSDYPPMRYLSDRYGLNARFFDPFDSRELARMLKFMEENWEAERANLPDRETLMQFGWERMAPLFFEKLQPYIGG